MWRRTAGLTQAAAAAYLGVSPRTVRYWETPAGSVPLAAFRLMKIRAGYELPDPAWEGWTLRNGVLWSPANQGFEPPGMWYLSLTFRMAEAWKRDYDRRCEERKGGLQGGTSPSQADPQDVGLEASATSAPEANDASLRDGFEIAAALARAAASQQQRARAQESERRLVENSVNATDRQSLPLAPKSDKLPRTQGLTTSERVPANIRLCINYANFALGCQDA